MITTAELGDYFEWEGQLVQCKWITDRGSKVIGFVKKEPCPHCGGLVEHSVNVIESSPMFQQGAKPVKTIRNQEDAEFVETPTIKYL